MQPRDGFITRSWMNLGTGASRRLSTLGSCRRMKVSWRIVTQLTPRGLIWMSSHGREGVWASWRLHSLSWRLRVRVSFLLLGSRESLKLDELTFLLQVLSLNIKGRSRNILPSGSGLSENCFGYLFIYSGSHSDTGRNYLMGTRG